MQVQIKFITSGANSIYGGFAAGDLLRVPEDIAAHLVEIGAAKFTETKEEVKPSDPVKPRKKVK